MILLVVILLLSSEHVRRLPSAPAGDATRIGMVIGVATGLVAWVIALAIDRL